MSQLKNFISLPITKVVKDRTYPQDDRVVQEVPVTLFLNDEEFVTLVCSPQHLRELAVGFLCSEGILQQPSDLHYLSVNEKEGIIKINATAGQAEKQFLKRYITSCCGRGRSSFYFINDARSMSRINSHISITPYQVWNLTTQLESMSTLFQNTGGVHNAALCTPENVVVFFEDIGRHNAVDKIFGHCFLKTIQMNDKILVFSGRISSEILIKVAKMNIPILVSRSAPTALAVNMANELGMTVVGFARDNRFNIYTNPRRIII
ncbi:FdhD protein [Desulfohalotomaculum tongense]|uniref:formate dehydrogenase accessory sulfurtransferase FdhD n=1 Tax=Desulforadius tongensis TaxID=1216062 RepID=UPI00195B592F|nr:formate dehydrogenase accessory sulfurtransferase FdhD [Desulforadius tongensis]MBM7855337.1 FdhD protein [Desulforadius tongensis]